MVWNTHTDKRTSSERQICGLKSVEYTQIGLSLQELHAFPPCWAEKELKMHNPYGTGARRAEEHIGVHFPPRKGIWDLLN